MPESSPPPDEDDEEDAEGETEDELFKNPPKESLMDSVGESPRGLKRSRNGQVREQVESDMPSIARSFARDSAPAGLDRSDDTVLQTENIISSLDTYMRHVSLTDADDQLTKGAAKLTKLWAQHSNPKSRPGAVGPESDDPLTKANYLSSLLLQLHHPHSSKPIFVPSPSKLQRSLLAPKQSQTSSIPLPRALLDWLDTYHTPFPDDFQTISTFRPSPSANDSYWDIVFIELARGRVQRAIRLLKDAGWEHAVSAKDDGSRDKGYTGRQLENTQEVVARCVRVLETCPAVQSGDWDIRGPEWAIYRQRLRQAVKDLELFANEDRDEEPDLATSDLTGGANVFARFSQQDTSPGQMNMSTASLRAASRVPWTIYENVKIVYRLFLGGDELLDTTQDWLEAAVLLTVWWDGEDAAPAAPRASLSKSGLLRRGAHAAGTREVDVAPLVAYRKRLGAMLRLVVEEMEEVVFAPDTLDAVHVGLACVMEDSVESVVGLLRVWSLTVAEAVVEVAALGAWLPQTRPRSKGWLEQEGFSSEDLMVLSHGVGQREKGSGDVDRDEVLSEYAELLAEKDVFKSSDGKFEREGWGLAVSVLGRLDDRDAAQSKIAELLDALQLNEEARVDKVLALCGSMGLSEQTRSIAEVL